MRRILLVFLINLFAFNTNLKAQIPAKDSLTINPVCDSIVNYAKTFLGTKYKYGACSPEKGFDCSGFVYYVFKHFNMDVPRASMDYEKMGKIIPIDSANVGDIVVFTGTNPKNRYPGHVGIVLSKPGENFTFIHSSSSEKKSGVKISSYADSPGYKVRFIKIVRLALK